MDDPVFIPAAPGVDLLKTPFGEVWSGVYLVRGEENILIDSGASAAVADEVIVPALAKLGLGPGDIDLLLCTHSHGDHVGGHRRLLERGVKRCGVFSGGAEKLRNPMKYSKLIRAEFPEFSPPPPPVLDGVEPEVLIADGETVGRLKLIHTPGHDSDCVSFLDRPTGTLLTGDSVQGNGTVVQGCALYMDLPAYRASLRKLLAEPLRAVVPGHSFLPLGETFPDSPEKSRAILRECLELTGLYDILLAEAATGREPPLPELARELIRRTGGRMPAHLFLALYTAREHWKERTSCHQTR
ncbi:MAG: MBL fold metallo-hydrolase [Lentisphaeria bacterium]|nr:MBL fold metallo-hydrolase [Lentisphaeria bacterium]